MRWGKNRQAATDAWSPSKCMPHAHIHPTGHPSPRLGARGLCFSQTRTGRHFAQFLVTQGLQSLLLPSRAKRKSSLRKQ